MQRFEEFRRAPVDSPATVEGHLLNVSSTGRWQQWEAAIDQFQSAPLRGDGAGSYGAWWLQHGQIRGFVTEAYLYLEVLGELGIVGLSLLIGALGLGLATVSSSRSGWRASCETTAGVTAAAGAYLVGASIDWVWELTVVWSSVSGLGLACCSGRGSMTGQPNRAARWVIAAVAVAAIALQAIPYLTQALLRDSERAVARGDIGAAITAADGASRIQPWAASPPARLRERERRQSADCGTAPGRGAAVGLRRLAPLARRDAAPREAGRDCRGAVGACRGAPVESQLLRPGSAGRGRQDTFPAARCRAHSRRAGEYEGTVGGTRGGRVERARERRPRRPRPKRRSGTTSTSSSGASGSSCKRSCSFPQPRSRSR